MMWSCPPSPASTHMHRLSNQLCVTQESTDLLLLYWEVLWFIATRNYIIGFLWKKLLDLIECFMKIMVCWMNMSITWSAWLSKKLPIPEEKVFYSFPSLVPPLPTPYPIPPIPTPSPSPFPPHPHSHPHPHPHPHEDLPSSHYIMVHTVVSAFPKGTPLKLLSHFYDDGLFQSFHNLVWSCGTRCYTVTTKS